MFVAAAALLLILNHPLWHCKQNMEYLLVCLISSVIITLGSCQCEGNMTADGYTVSWNKDLDEDWVRFIVSVNTPSNTWVAVGFSENQIMINSDIVIGSYNENGKSFVEDRWAFARQRPSYDIEQNIRNTSINFTDGEMTMIFIRDIISADVNNDTDLSQCVYLLRAWGGNVTNFTSPALFNKHVNNGVFDQQICLQDCVDILPSLSFTISTGSSTNPSSTTTSSTTSSSIAPSSTTSIGTSGTIIPTISSSGFPHDALSTGLVIAISVGGGLVLCTIFLVLALLLIWKVCCSRNKMGYEVRYEEDLEMKNSPVSSRKNPDFSGKDYDGIRHIL